MIVAIDGPAGAGKTTVARAVARRLGFAHLDTGALYRAVTWLALEAAVPLDAPDELARLVSDAVIRLDGEKVTVDERDVTAEIRAPEVTRSVSQVAAHPAVRSALVPHQRASGSADAVIEGRDIGTRVFPDAEVKIFLTANPRARAERRARELNDGRPLGELEAEMEARDRSDSTRAASPLQRADGALELDTSDMSFDAVVERVVEAVGAARAPT